MPDRELLELAARAVDVDLYWREESLFGSTAYRTHKGVSAGPTRWMPLDDDGDAFRLAADLDLFALPEYWSMLARVRLLGGTDKYANVRRALVWTAVERHLEKKARKPVPAGEPQ